MTKPRTPSNAFRMVLGQLLSDAQQARDLPSLFRVALKRQLFR
jgi:hypothetical protein